MQRDRSADKKGVTEPSRLIEGSAWTSDAFAHAAVGMALIDRGGAYRRVNDRFCEILGRPAEEIIGHRTVDLSHPDDVAMGAAVVAALSAGQMDSHRAAKRFVRPDGTVVHVLRMVRLVRDEAGEPAYLFAQYVDVTEQVVRADGLVRLGRLALADPSPGELHTAAVDLVGRALGVRAAEAERCLERAGAGRDATRVREPVFAVLGAADDDFVEHVAQILASESSRLQAQAWVQHAAWHDSLTGLPNRAYFERSLATHPGPVAVIMLDLDQFKDVNDSQGHAAGDRLLDTVAQLLRRALRPGDLVARLGGDEFGVLVSARVPADGVRVGERLLVALTDPVRLDGYEVVVRASLGVAWSAGPVSSPDRLLADADLAMYEAKAAGRGRVEVFGPRMRERADARLDVERRTRAALASGAFSIGYQPIVDLVDGRWAGVESLLRWAPDDPSRLPPATFIPVAERIGVMPTLGRLGLGQTLADLTAWSNLDPPGQLVPVSVNLSATQLLDEPTISMLLTARSEGLVRPHQLIVEVTESALLAPSSGAEQTLARLRAGGLLVALDDFGTGYSSLSYLVHLPVDVLKMDASFVAGLVEGPRQQAVLRAVVGLASELGLQVVAEGVETRDQADLLVRLGCGTGRGGAMKPT